MPRSDESPGPQTVLVVDDDPDARALLEALLQSEGYLVAQVESAADAIAFLDEHEPPCLVLVDMIMPGIVGTSLLEYMEHDDALDEVPVAIVSGSPQLAPPRYPLFPKPIDVGAFLAFVNASCAIGRPARPPRG